MSKTKLFLTYSNIFALSFKVSKIQFDTFYITEVKKRIEEELQARVSYLLCRVAKISFTK